MYNYSRFVKGIIDSYFERKYEIKSSLHQITYVLSKLREYVSDYEEVKGRSRGLRQSMGDCQRRINFL